MTLVTRGLAETRGIMAGDCRRFPAPGWYSSPPAKIPLTIFEPDPAVAQHLVAAAKQLGYAPVNLIGNWDAFVEAFEKRLVGIIIVCSVDGAAEERKQMMELIKHHHELYYSQVVLVGIPGTLNGFRFVNGSYERLILDGHPVTKAAIAALERLAEQRRQATLADDIEYRYGHKFPGRHW